MATSIPLIGNKNACCTIETVNNGTSYLSCNVKRSSDPFFHPSPISEFRPFFCELPGAIHEHEGDNGVSPLDECAYKYSNMSRCGCPTLDPKKNPKLWEKYVNSVANIVLQNIDGNAKEITLTFFASGHLLQDCQLLDYIFNLEKFKNWKGNLNLQFVDLNYEVDKVQLLKNRVVSTSDNKKGMNWGFLVAAIVCGSLGTGAIYAGTQQEKKERKYSCMGVGAILIIVAVILGVQAAPKKEEEKKFGGNYSVSQIKMKNSAEIAVEGFLNQMAARLPKGISIETSFFPNADACIEEGKATDAILGYDIDNSLRFFESLRKNKLKEYGAAIVVVKMEGDQKTSIPVFYAARGRVTSLLPQKI